MSELLGLEHLSLRSDGPTLTLSVGLGHSLAIAGPAASGKSRLLGVLAGRERPAQGTIKLHGRAVVAGESPLPRRAKVQSYARKIASSVNQATEILTATRLWDVRHLSVGDLTPSQLAACDLLEPLLVDEALVAIDGQLDQLDPWALRSVLDLMRLQMGHGRTFAVVTHRPDLIQELETLIVLRDQQVRFAGSVADLLRGGPPHEIEVATENQPAVRALVSPFQVRVSPTDQGLRLEAPEGQEIAARLLLQGYGDIKYVVVRRPTIEEALRAL
jgi:ABC-type multidrug transport system ATPase subunit